MALRRSAREEALRPGMAVKTVLVLSSVMLVAYALHALFGVGGHRLDGFYLK